MPNDQENKIKETVAKVLKLKIDKITSETGPLNTAEWDSFCHMQILSEVETLFHIEFDPDKISSLLTVKDIVSHVNNLFMRDGLKNE